MKITRDVVYEASHGVRGVGDLFLPQAGAKGARGAPVLLIHGGGWNAMAKESIEPFARLFAGRGRAVFNVNYRLLDHGPWPACLEDCVAAGALMLAGGLAEHGLEASERLVVCGASAGGHLAMMTGLELGAKRVALIVSISGPSRMDFPDGSTTPHFKSAAFCEQFFGRSRQPTAAEIAEVSPAARVRAGAPPLVCIHSENDRLVPISHSREAVAAWRGVGCEAELIAFDGPGDSHGIWDPEVVTEDLSQRRPVAAVVEAVEGVCGGGSVGGRGGASPGA